MNEAIRRILRRLAAPARVIAWKSGIGYVANYLANCREFHRSERFAGNLTRWNQNVVGEPTEVAEIAEIFESIVLPNGVRKTTTPGRQVNILRHFLSRHERPAEGANLRILDLPSSNGVGCVDSYKLLRCHYGIADYVLADLCLELKYDRQLKAVYTAAGELLQVQGRKHFINIHRAHMTGATYTWLSGVLLWPASLRARWLERQYAIGHPEKLDTIRLLHPEVERCVGRGMFTVRNADVFALSWREEFDLVLSFNLLQRNYFSPARISQGLQNLGQALCEGGYLITGNTESFGVMRKISGALVMQYRCGEW